MLPGLARRALAEAVGSAGLLAAVIGSGIAAQRLSPGDVGLQLLENSVATTLALVALILSLGAVSGAHLNPLVSGLEWARGRLTAAEAGTYVLAQGVGAVLGAVLANAMFDLPLIEASTHVRAGGGLWLGEAVAACGLLLVVHGTLASNAKAVPLAVGAYIGAAYWFTSSTSFANPAVTFARSLSNSFAGIAPASVPGFLAAQVAGALLAIPLLAGLFPGWWRSSRRKPQILFVCVHNAGRSQMAAAFARHLGQGRVEVLSAGSAPGERIHPVVEEAMKEVGIDLGRERPKLLSDASVQASDVVITMGCGDACPVHPGKRYEDWALDDPAGQPLPKVRAIRDAIRARVERLLADL